MAFIRDSIHVLTHYGYICTGFQVTRDYKCCKLTKRNIVLGSMATSVAKLTGKIRFLFSLLLGLLPPLLCGLLQSGQEPGSQSRQRQ